MPGVQKPHCRPCSVLKPSCSGWSWPSLDEALDGQNFGAVGLHRKHGA